MPQRTEIGLLRHFCGRDIYPVRPKIYKKLKINKKHDKIDIEKENDTSLLCNIEQRSFSKQNKGGKEKHALCEYQSDAMVSISKRSGQNKKGRKKK